MHVIVPAAFLLLVGFQAGRMACSFGELEAAAGGDSPGAQRAILSRINRLERLAELAAQARPGSGGALALVGGKPEDPATRDARKLRSLASGWVSGAACKDKDAGCAGWAAKGECASNKAYMDETCPLSCNRCAAGAKAATNVAGPASAAADGAAAAGPTGKDGCPLNRRPFHVIQTADSSTYQQWQVARGCASRLARACIGPTRVLARDAPSISPARAARRASALRRRHSRSCARVSLA
jgi:hypothetical protein